jgi:hypothetical protein
LVPGTKARSPEAAFGVALSGPSGSPCPTLQGGVVLGRAVPRGTMRIMSESVPAESPRDQKPFHSERAFQVWRYDVGHRLLLLRSVKDAQHSSRIDVLFSDSSNINLPTSFVGLRIRPGQDGNYLLSGAGWAGEVRAASVADREDNGEYFEEGPSTVPFSHGMLRPWLSVRPPAEPPRAALQGQSAAWPDAVKGDHQQGHRVVASTDS